MHRDNTQRLSFSKNEYIPHSLAEPPTSWKYCWAILRCSLCKKKTKNNNKKIYITKKKYIFKHTFKFS